MASIETITRVVNMLFLAPLANKPKPLPNQTEAAMMAETAKIYALTLQDIDDNLLQAAVINHLATEKWFPAVADIRKSALSLVNRADRTPSAYEAWQEVKTALRNYGSWRASEGEAALSPLTQTAVRYFGGLKEFCSMESDDESSWRMRFIQAYEQLQHRQADEAMTLPAIAGYIEKRRELGGESVASLIAGAASKMIIKKEGNQ